MKYIYIILISCLPGVIAGQSLCFTPDSTIWENTWESCETSENPNADRGQSHWIQYDFGEVYRLGRSYVWNTNEPDKLDRGFKEVVVDYSTDGQAWTELGVYEWPQGSGEAVYAGFAGPDFAGANMRYVLVTSLTNWGNARCAGLAEMKFNIRKAPASEKPDCFYREFEGGRIPFAVYCYVQSQRPGVGIEAMEAYVCKGKIVEGEIYLEDGTELFLEEGVLEDFEDCQGEEDDASIFSEVRLFPNPAQEETALMFESERADEGLVRLLDINGRTLWKSTIEVREEENYIDIPLESLPSGIYFVSLTTDSSGERLARRVVVLRD